MALATALVMAGCGSDITEVPEATPQLNSFPTGRVRLVKFGPAGTTATFSISATGGNLPVGSTVTVDACPEDGTVDCSPTDVWFQTGPELVHVTITETGSTGNVILNRINVISDLDGTYNILNPNPPTVTVRVDGANSAVVRFKNIPDDNVPALRVVKTAAQENVTAGGSISFAMDVYSDGPGVARGVTLTDALPGGAGVDWSTATPGCAITGSAPAQTLNCELGDMPAGSHAQVTVSSATSNLVSCGTYPNTVTVGATNHADVSSQATINVIDCYVPQPGLRVVKTAVNSLVTAGGTMAFTMTVTSTGDATATNVTLTDALPGGPGVNWSTTTPGCTISGGVPTQTLNCSLGNMAPGTSKTVTVSSGTSTKDSCGDYTNTVNVSASNHGTVSSTAIISVGGCTQDGLAGCTPGFWKQRQHYSFWTAPYTPTTQFSAVFANAFPGKTLLDVLGQGGGGLIALGRHTVAALLNGASPDVDYGMSAAAVIAAFNNAYATGNYDALHLELERRNERDCTAKD